MKNAFLVRDSGETGPQNAGMRKYAEDLRPCFNMEIGSKAFCKSVASRY